MADIDDKINELERRLDQLVRTQIDFQKNVSQIRYEIGLLRAIQQKRSEQASPSQENLRPRPPVDRPYRQPERVEAPPPHRPDPGTRPELPPQWYTTPADRPPPSTGAGEQFNANSESTRTESAFSRYMSQYAESARANLEEFIGENLISKIGIIVLLLGIGIGVKYAIDNDLISPLTRIILGYIFGFGLIGFAVRLKPRYQNFSAVLLSGGLASMYFVTYFAFASYSLIDQRAAFGLMVMFTVATVVSALVYNRQIIAHIGLVGAYAVPFLLSTGSAAYAFLFSYMTIVNAGILAISIRREWRPIIYTSSIFTWLIFAAWIAGRYSGAEHFNLALIFLWLFFAIFYAANVVLSRDDHMDDDRQGLITATVTTGVFYTFCFTIGQTIDAAQFRTLFTYVAATSLVVQITAGLSAIEIKDAHKWLFYVASVESWAMLISWLSDKYTPGENFVTALVFTGVFFTIFFGTRIVHALRRPEDDRSENLVSTILTTLGFYGVCFGLSNLNPGNRDISVLFGYLAVASVAILIISYRIYGRFLIAVSYPLAWLIYGAWFLQHYSPESNFLLAAVFAGVFFFVFYGTTLVYRLFSIQIGIAEHSALMLTNSFVFYGFGYAILDSREDLRPFEGLYTAAHGVFHFIVAQAIGRARQNVSDVVQVLTILVITFLTIAVPVQFDGNRVTMIWAVEGALLFWFARARQIRIFEYYSYPVLALATGSLILDWIIAYADRTPYPSELNAQVFANGNFVTAIVFIGAFASVFVVNRSHKYLPAISSRLVKPVGYIVATIGMFVLFNTFRTEIDNYYHLVAASARAGESVHTVTDAQNLSAIWQMIYSMVFFAAMNLVNIRWARSLVFGYAAVVLSMAALLAFLLPGTYVVNELRISYMASEAHPAINIGIRYFGYFAAAFLFYGLYLVRRDISAREHMPERSAELIFDGSLAISTLILATSELTQVMSQYHFPDATKYGWSVLWGIYALSLIAVGIRRAKKHLRIGGIVLIGVTLAKLFSYDIADLPTIPKTILFVSLGILMLVVSFLYTKYKYAIFREPSESKEL